MAEPDEERIVKILGIMERMKDNHAACWSSVTHVIFEDNNLSMPFIDDAIRDGYGWLEYIKDMQDNGANGYMVSMRLIDIGEVIKALYELRDFTDSDLREASRRLNGER